MNKKPMIKVLIVTAGLHIGGAEKVAANISAYAPSEQFQIDYLIFKHNANGYESEIIHRGGKIFCVESPTYGACKFICNIMTLNKERKYDVIHCHNMFSCGWVVLAGYLTGIPVRICHAHTANAGIKGLRKKCYALLMRLMMYMFGTHYLACGVDAGNELYGQRFFNKHGKIVTNGIDVGLFRFHQESRNLIRDRYNLRSKLAIISIGHYIPLKNQVFLIRLMPDLLKLNSDSILFLFGDGSNRDNLQREIDILGLNEHAKLMGNVFNINEILSGMDIFVMPSLYEGTPLSLLEAQINGMPCIVSNKIPKDAIITDLVTVKHLDDHDGWIQSIIDTHRENSESYAEIVKKTYGTVEDSMHYIYKIYKGEVL